MSGFAPFDYRPQFSEASGQVGAGAVGSGEGAGFSRGPFSYLSGDTGEGIELVGWRNENGDVFDPAQDKRGFAVLDKFLCIPSDGTLAPMSMAAYSFNQLEVFTSDFVANGLAVYVIQIDRASRLPTPAQSDEVVLYGPERFAKLDNSVRVGIKPLEVPKPGVPMFLRVVTIGAIAEFFLPVTKTVTIETPEGNPAPANPFVTTVSPAKYRILYSIPLSVARVAR